VAFEVNTAIKSPGIFLVAPIGFIDGTMGKRKTQETLSEKYSVVTKG